MPKEAKITLEEDEQTFPLKAKKYKSGSRGFYGFGKMRTLDDGKSWQVIIHVVEIRSKERD